jgi:hypothetical protein
MERDPRYQNLRDLLVGGFIEDFDQLFTPIPKSVIYTDLGMNYVRFQKLINDPLLFTYKETKALASLIGCDPKYLMDLIYKRMMAPAAIKHRKTRK